MELQLLGDLALFSISSFVLLKYGPFSCLCQMSVLKLFSFLYITAEGRIRDLI